jgi:hypothetical protein
MTNSTPTDADKPIFNVICIKWGATEYTPDYVNRLCNMVKRNTTYDIRFYCFTDDPQGLSDDVIAQPMTTLNVPPEDNKYGYKKEAGLCDDNLGGLNGQRVFFFDLDVVIIDNIDCFFEFPKDKEFVIINDWNTKGDHIGQASCYSWVVGELGFVKTYFEQHAKQVVDKYYTASQEFLSEQVIARYGKLTFWPDSWSRSFRFHCAPKGILRYFFDAKIPEGAKILVFHGSPKPHEALAGIWSTSSHRKTPFWKRFYKVIRPTKWVADYWK